MSPCGHLHGSLLSGDEVAAGGAPFRRVTDHRDFFRDGEGKKVILSRFPALSSIIPQNGGIIGTLLETIVGDDLTNPRREVFPDPKPPVQGPCIDLAVFGERESGGFMGMVVATDQPPPSGPIGLLVH